MQIIHQNLTASQVNRYGLILTACGISFHAQKTGRTWNILVDAPNAEKATRIIEESLSEKKTGRLSANENNHLQAYTGLWISAVIITVHIAMTLSNKSRLFMDTFQSSAARIMTGEYYRTITALFLHADLGHLAGNVIGIAIFGTALCRIAGRGMGVLMILLSGGMGNLLNVIMYRNNHISIGSSTAVFGTIGILSGYLCIMKFRQDRLKRTAWLPVGGGLALLAFVGAGSHTDVTAHLFGMLVGFIFGIMLANWKDYLQHAYIQMFSMIVAAGIAAGSFFQGYLK